MSKAENRINVIATGKRKADGQARLVSWPAFLGDVLVCSLGAYGGLQAHMGVYLNRMVEKRGYLTESELIELMALCSILPGPTSTQTIVSIGYRMGGPRLALLTMLLWPSGRRAGRRRAFCGDGRPSRRTRDRRPRRCRLSVPLSR